MQRISCPNCDSPIEFETAICPYCHASTTGGSTASYTAYAIVLGVALLIGGGIFAYDYSHGTKILPQVMQFFNSED